MLTVSPRAYPDVNDSLLLQIPKTVKVHRAFGLDARRHLAYKGKYLSAFDIPDRYSTWIPFAIAKGLAVAGGGKIDAIFSTYPIATTHLIGYSLHKLLGKPWVADFRDPMWDDYTGEASNTLLKRRKAIEALAVKHCSSAIVTTQGMQELYAGRYSKAESDKVKVIPNGFDENDFTQMESAPARTNGKVTLVHPGLLDAVDRNPVHFFRAIDLVIKRGWVKREMLRINLYAPGEGQQLPGSEELKSLGLEDVVNVLGPVPYQESLAIMSKADVLLLFQGPSCDHQIPAKLYEYMRIGRPILALTTEKGDTGRLVTSTASGFISPIDDVEAIANALRRVVTSVEQGIALPQADRSVAARFSRQSQAKELAGVFDRILDGK